MGRAIANSTNAAQGWRKPLYTPEQMREAGINPSGQVKAEEKPMGMGMSYDRGGKGCCFPTGNKHRGKGSSDKRQRSGRMTSKHQSPQTKAV